MTSDKIISKIKKAMPEIIRKANNEQRKIIRSVKKCTNCGGKGYTTQMVQHAAHPLRFIDLQNPCRYCKGTGYKKRGVRVPRVRGTVSFPSEEEKKVIIMKPMTGMNNSGKVVKEFIDKYNQGKV